MQLVVNTPDEGEKSLQSSIHSIGFLERVRFSESNNLSTELVCGVGLGVTITKHNMKHTVAAKNNCWFVVWLLRVPHTPFDSLS